MHEINKMMKNKREEIIEKVSVLYNEYGIKSITMDDVVHELGISKKTLYQYFSDKTQLVSDVMDALFAKRKDEMIRLLEGKANAIEEMLTYYHLQMKMIKEHRPTLIYDLRKYYPEIFDKVTQLKRKYMFDSVLSNLKRGKREKLYRAEINEEIVARMNLMKVEAIMSSGIFSHEEIMDPEFFKEMFTFHMYGVVNDNGRKILEQNIDQLK
jgi:AcrR family transcriptional regulator